MCKYLVTFIMNGNTLARGIFTTNKPVKINKAEDMTKFDNMIKAQLKRDKKFNSAYQPPWCVAFTLLQEE